MGQDGRWAAVLLRMAKESEDRDLCRQTLGAYKRSFPWLAVLSHFRMTFYSENLIKSLSLLILICVRKVSRPPEGCSYTPVFFPMSLVPPGEESSDLTQLIPPRWCYLPRVPGPTVQCKNPSLVPALRPSSHEPTSQQMPFLLVSGQKSFLHLYIVLPLALIYCYIPPLDYKPCIVVPLPRPTPTLEATCSPPSV